MSRRFNTTLFMMATLAVPIAGVILLLGGIAFALFGPLPTKKIWHAR